MESQCHERHPMAFVMVDEERVHDNYEYGVAGTSLLSNDKLHEVDNDVKEVGLYRMCQT